MKEPGAERILELIEAFRRSKTMFVAVSMGIFDKLAARAASAGELAGDGDAEAMVRLLDACVSLDLLERTPFGYRNTEIADKYLVRSSPDSLAGYILYSDRVLYRLWENLEDGVKEGSNRWRQTFGFEGGLFSNFFKTTEAQLDFLRGMHGVGLLASGAVVSAFDLSGYRSLVDLGGATGHLAAAARARYPKMEVAVFDLPSVVELPGLPRDGSVSYLAGDFFKGPLPAADIFALGRILHDWPESKVRALLKRLHARLPSGGALLIAERLLDDNHSGPVSATMQSLNMLLCTEGKERSLAEYEELLNGAGFVEVKGRRTGRPLDAILARKPAQGRSIT